MISKLPRKHRLGISSISEAAVDPCRRIESLKSRRLTLEEIRAELDGS